MVIRLKVLETRPGFARDGSISEDFAVKSSIVGGWYVNYMESQPHGITVFESAQI